ncbi:MAG: hypothetical protein COA58_09495 [Bacteroidetes bacterium]|nr:MAG: hypothetical protein COA58_09495 [Bacteroidota bacterium]
MKIIKILLLGGTNFIGRNLIEQLLLNKGYELTMFNRGITNADLFPEVNRIQGNRESDDISQILNTEWDYIIDLSCYFPGSLNQIVSNLKHPPKKYIFISTCSVYDNEQCTEILREETTPILKCTEAQKTDESMNTYGNRKAECERVLSRSSFNYTIFRPALVYGKYDSSDRLYYWLHQVKNKATLLLPESGERYFSTTYVHDLVRCIIQQISPNESRRVFNVITTPKTSILQLVNVSKKLLHTRPATQNIDANFLNKNNIAPWMDMPLWLNADYFTYSNEQSINELSFVPTSFEKAIADTIDYFLHLNWPEPSYGISENQRLDLLDKIRSENTV